MIVKKKKFLRTEHFNTPFLHWFFTKVLQWVGQTVFEMNSHWNLWKILEKWKSACGEVCFQESVILLYYVSIQIYASFKFNVIIKWSPKFLKAFRWHLPWFCRTWEILEKITPLDLLKCFFRGFFALNK